LSDTETSIPTTAFVIVYLITSPVFGSLADRGFSRKVLMCIGKLYNKCVIEIGYSVYHLNCTCTLLTFVGVIIWSISTAAVFFSNNFPSFLVCRMIVGIGEAAYASITPALLSDFFPRSQRNKVFTIFYLAIPYDPVVATCNVCRFGAAIGFGIGGAIGDAIGWRYAFLICGVPGLVLALLCLLINDPGMGYYDKKKKLNEPWWTVCLYTRFC
jgi:MFS family permease